MDHLQIGDFRLVWLNGGKILLDGGAMFGVVPKFMWSKRYPCNDLNQIKMRVDPILIQTDERNILIDTGMGSRKLDESQKRRMGLVEESTVEQSLRALGLTPQDIDYVLLTHLHNDHAAGLTRKKDDRYTAVFSEARHYVEATEWQEARHPNIRTRNTYLEENWQPVEKIVQTYNDRYEVLPGVDLIHTGGHSAGHAIVRIESKGEVAYHLSDILPTHAHRNPLWVMAYDDYPMDSIFAKEKWIQKAIEEEAWFVFYHDYFYRAIKWDLDGNIVGELKAPIES
ncbi:hypothetical protein BEP19_11380 [Ammoniphilus oxalaticus]|uniref:Metallo-beta-lactamase domain-containing protein n=1 Tax=Ammoniphilus oxalaticus TaxID=66863 RepID=A0A419SGB9_9BACL|nr:MBL fold metallo-hydrolase [Ammoniphilus oxalaticus]RKD22837.1 hypothetical protein BEP19_11380 [Ammoniphilus oxalaticus]